MDEADLAVAIAPRKRRTLGARLVRLLTAPARSLHYKTLFALHARRLTLQPEEFRGRKVLIIGPASTVAEELEDFDPADFDIVVRMNKSIDVPVEREGRQIWRIDLLFHGFGTEGIRASGEVTRDKLDRSGVGTVVHRTTGKSRLPQTLAIERRLRAEGSTARVKILPPSFYRGLRRQLSDHSPTTGLTSIAFFIGCDTACLGIIGFTFYKTSYIAGYQDAVTCDADAPAYARHRNIHDPDLERALTARMCASARQSGKRVLLGRHLALLLGQ